MIGQWAWVWRMRLMVTMCKYISVLYVDINKFAIVVVHNGPLKKIKINKLKKKSTQKIPFDVMTVLMNSRAKSS